MCMVDIYIYMDISLQICIMIYLKSLGFMIHISIYNINVWPGYQHLEFHGHYMVLLQKKNKKSDLMLWGLGMN